MKRCRGTGAVLIAGMCCFLLWGNTVKAEVKTMPDGGKFDPQFYAESNPDVKAAFGTDEALLYGHYQMFGVNEGRSPYAGAQAQGAAAPVVQPAPAAPAQTPVTNAAGAAADGFDAAYYAAAYPDVRAALGNDATMLYLHYVNFGKAEGRKPNAAAAGTPAPAVVTAPPVTPGAPMIALTFDDGPSVYDDRIMTALEAVGGRGTFFMIGNTVAGHPAQVQRMAAMGHELGNHSWSHPNLALHPAENVQASINNTNAAIAALTGRNATVMRPPYGEAGGAVKPVMAANGYAVILWNIDTLDWKTRNTQAVVNAVLNNVNDGDIVLLHSIHPTTIAAVEQFVPVLAARGYQMVTVSQLIASRGGAAPGTVVYGY